MTEQIELVFLNREEMPLFYVEAGNHYLSSGSEEKDYEVRGFHMVSRNQYFHFATNPTTIETRYENFDFLSYNLDKMFLLLSNSNPTAIEWLRADHVYLNKVQDWDVFKTMVLSNVDLKPIYYHYLSISRTNIRILQKGREFNWKTILATIRGILSAGLAAGNILPEFSIQELLARYEPGNELVKLAAEALSRNKTDDSGLTDAKKDIILNVLESYASRLEIITLHGTHKNRKALETVLQEYCYQLKATNYCNW